MTAFKFISAVPLLTVSNNDASGLKLKFGTVQAGNGPGNLYSNRFTAFSETFSQPGGTHQLLTSNQTTVKVVGFSLGDFVWLDNDGNGVFEDSKDVVAPAGIPIEVFRDGVTTPVATTSTDAEGRWIVNDLARGKYYVQIPASVFLKGGALYRYEPALKPVLDANTDVNEDVDHHAIAGTAGAARSSGLIDLLTEDDGPTIKGLEPLADNVKNLPVSTLTADEFTNLTVDLAFAPVPGYEFSKASDPASGSAVMPGSEVTYTLTGSNTGQTALDPVVINDDLSAVLEHGELVGAPVATIAGGSGVAPPAVTDDVLNWTGVLQSDQRVVITYTVRLNDDAVGVIISNIANSEATPPVGPPIVPPPGQTFHPTPGFTFFKEADPVTGTTVVAGTEITYTLHGHNLGQTVLDPVIITDELAGVLAYADLTSDPVAVTIIDEVETPAPPPTIEDDKLVWENSLAIGQSVQIKYTVTVKEGMEGKILANKAKGSGTPPGLPPIETPEISTEHPVPGYEVAKTADPKTGSTLPAGTTVTYTVTGKNTGATVLNEVTIDDDLSKVLNNATLVGAPRAAIVSAAGSRPATAPTLVGTTLNWVGDLAIGENVVLTYQVKINDSAHLVSIENVVTSHATPPGVPTIKPPPVTTTHRTEAAPPEKLVVTGIQLAGLSALTAVLLGAGWLVVGVNRRRKNQTIC